MNSSDENEPDIEELIEECCEDGINHVEFGYRLEYLLFIARQQFPMEPVDD